MKPAGLLAAATAATVAILGCAKPLGGVPFSIDDIGAHDPIPSAHGPIPDNRKSDDIYTDARNVTDGVPVNISARDSCKAYISHVWDWYYLAMTRHKVAFWCENCPMDKIDMIKAGKRYGYGHQSRCDSLNAYMKVYWDTTWKKYVIDTSEVIGEMGWDDFYCMIKDFSIIWNVEACRDSEQKATIQNYGGRCGTGPCL